MLEKTKALMTKTIDGRPFSVYESSSKHARMNSHIRPVGSTFNAIRVTTSKTPKQLEAKKHYFPTNA